MLVSLPEGVGVDAEAVKSVHVRSESGTGRGTAVVYSVVVRTETDKHVVAVCASRDEAQAVTDACWARVNEVLGKTDTSPTRFPWPSRRALARRAAGAEVVARDEQAASPSPTTAAPAAAAPRSPLADVAPAAWDPGLRRSVELAGASLVAEGEELAVPELAAAVAALGTDPGAAGHPLLRLVARNPDAGGAATDPAAVPVARAAWAGCVREALHAWRCAEADAEAPPRVRGLVDPGPPAGSPDDAIGRLAVALGEPAGRVAATFGLKPPREVAAPDPAYREAPEGEPWPGPWPEAATEPDARLRAAASGWGPWYREAARRGLAPRVDGHVGNQLAMWQRAVGEHVPREPAKRLRRARGVGQALGWVVLAVDALLAVAPHEVVAGPATALREAALARLRRVVDEERELPVAFGRDRGVGRLWSALREGFDGAVLAGAVAAGDAAGLDGAAVTALKAFEDRFAALADDASGAGSPEVAGVVAAGEAACASLARLRAAVGRSRHLDAWLEDLAWRVALRVHAVERWAAGERSAAAPVYDEAAAFDGAAWAARAAGWRSEGTFAARDLPATTPAAIDALVAARSRLDAELGHEGPVLPRQDRSASPRELEGGPVRAAQAEVARCAARLAPVFEALEAAALPADLRAFLAGHLATCRALGGPVAATTAVRTSVGLR